MASKIKVDQLLGSTGDVITVPTGQTLTVTDGIPVASGGTGIASFTAGDILYATGATTLAKLTKPGSTQVLQMTSGGTPSWVDAGGGGLLQLKQTQLTDTGSRTGTSWASWDASMNVVITPTLSTSKLLVCMNIPTACNNYGWLRLIREVSSSDTVIAIGDAIGSTRNRSTTGSSYVDNNYQVMHTNFMWLDAPATTSAITYKLESWQHGPLYFGRQVQDGDDNNSSTTVSTITAMEIAVGVL